MKKMNIIKTFFILTLILSCNNDDTCGYPNWVTPNNLENEYGCVDTKYQMDIELNDDYIIIRSQQSFDELITGDCSPQINFLIYDLLIGKKELTTGNASINYYLMKHPCNGQFYLEVNFYGNQTTEASNLTYHALIPKLNNNEIINIGLNVN